MSVRQGREGRDLVILYQHIVVFGLPWQGKKGSADQCSRLFDIKFRDLELLDDP